MRNKLAEKAILALSLTPLFTGAFLVLLWLSLSLNDAAIKANIGEDFDIVSRERADNGRSVDALTECTGLSFGLVSSDSRPADKLKEAIAAPTIVGCHNLEKFLAEDNDGAAYAYFRYWHGYSILTRPVLALLPYHDLRQHLLTASLALLGLFLWRMGHDFGARVALAFAVTYLVLNTFAYWIVATKAVTWFLMIGGALVISRRKTSPPPLLVFFTLGALTAFFDFLTAPMAIFSTAALTYGLYSMRNAEREELAFRTGALFAFFCAGYVGLWMMKFLVAAAVLETDVWADVTQAVLIRLRGNNSNIESFYPGAAIWSNLARLKVFWGPVALIVFGILPIASKSGRRCLMVLWRNCRSLIAIALAPVIWLELLSNHSQIHAHFTQMNFAPLFTLLAIAAFDRAGSFQSRAMTPLAGRASASPSPIGPAGE
jgi:pimeloyl-ACP methyl ester carboxylesterase